MRKADPELQERRRTEILTAAAACFAEKGFHRAAMSDIAKASGLSMGLLYRYFKNKEEIILSFAEIDRAEALTLIAEFGASDKPESAFMHCLQIQLNEIQNIDTVRITVEVFAEAARNSTLLQALQHDDASVRAGWRQAFAQQQQLGRMNTMLSPERLATLIMTLIDGIYGRVLCQSTQHVTEVLNTIEQLFKPFWSVSAHH